MPCSQILAKTFLQERNAGSLKPDPLLPKEVASTPAGHAMRQMSLKSRCMVKPSTLN